MHQQESGRARASGLTRRLTLSLAAVLVAAGGAGTVAWTNHDSAPASTASADVLGRAPATGAVRLLAFLATQPDTAATASRAEAVEIVSLQTQYGGKGLATEIVDETGASTNALVNTYYDWELGGVRLVADPSRALARRYHATSMPTVLVVDSAGNVLKRWDAYVPTVQIVEVITGKLAG